MSKGTTIEGNVKACRMVKDEGLRLNTGWIIGYPGETEETVQETIDLILKIKPTTANISPLIPYPGTAVYEEAKAEKMLIGDWGIDAHHLPWVKLPG